MCLAVRSGGVNAVTTLTTLVGCVLLAVGVWGSLATLWREQA
jgi:hypothetical protein